MYAIFEDGSRQYRVAQGETATIDHREGLEKGSRVEIDKVLLVAEGATTKIGQPYVSGAKVIGEVVDFPRVKTVAQSFRRRKASRRLRGHTQPHVKIMITEIIG